MMPALLLRFLPHIALAAALLGAIWYLDHQGYQRAQEDAKFERMVTAIMIDNFVDQLGEDLRAEISTIDRNLAGRISDIDLSERIILPDIEKEVRNENRLRDPKLGITDVMRNAINRARGESACAAGTSGGDCVDMPAARAAGE